MIALLLFETRTVSSPKQPISGKTTSTSAAKYLVVSSNSIVLLFRANRLLPVQYFYVFVRNHGQIFEA